MAGQTIKANAEFDSKKGKPKQPGTSLFSGVEEKIAGASYSSIGTKMLKAMKALKYREQQQNMTDAGKAEPEGKEDGEEPDDPFRIAAGKRKLDDPGLYYVSESKTNERE